jgi:hypothetical protein
MKTRHLLFLALIGLAAYALWVRRHARSTATPGVAPAATEFKAVNDWQQSIRVDPRTDYRRADTEGPRPPALLPDPAPPPRPPGGKP